MKTSKAAVKASTQEECGVWLDTVDLKGKAKKKKMVRPISKLLNPLARNGGYNLAVALNFTQTKIQLPATKQSSISSFFTPQHRAVSKASAAPDREPAGTSSSTSTRCTSTSPIPKRAGMKRKRVTDLSLAGPYRTEPQVSTTHKGAGGEDGGCEWNRMSMSTKSWQEQAIVPHFHMDHKSEEEEEEPVKKREFSRASSAPEETDPLGEQCREYPLSPSSSPQYSHNVTEADGQDYITQDSKGHYVPTHQELPKARQRNNPRPAFPESLLGEVEFGVGLGAEGRTSTQRRSALTPWMSQEAEGKENDPPSSPTSPIKSASLSPLKGVSVTPQYRWTEPSPPPRKQILQKPVREHVAEEDSVAVLFTQDSEGFRVMAHHHDYRQLSRSPLKDQTNMGCSRDNRSTAYVALQEEEEEDDEENMLFTQDSQGNMVIKH